MNSKNLPKGGSAISGLFVFLLIGLFAIASITLVLTGIKAYRGVTDSASMTAEQHLSLSYVGNKIRSFDEADSVTLEKRDGFDMLCLKEHLDGEVYETRIYYHDGILKEQFVDGESEFDPELGEELTELNGIKFEKVSPNLLRVVVTLMDGNEQTLHMALHSTQAG